MMTAPATQKPGTGHFRAINLLRKLGLPLFFSLIAGFLFSPGPVRALELLHDNFDSYNAGNLTGNDNWFLYEVPGMTYSGQLLGTNWYNPPLAVRFVSLTGGSGNIKIGNDSLYSGSLSFLFYFSGYNGGGSDYVMFDLHQNASTSGNIEIELLCSDNLTCPTAEIRAYYGSWGTFFTGIQKETWNYLKIDFAGPDQFKLTLNGNESSWITTAPGRDWAFLNSFAVWTGYLGSGTFNFWIDNIGGGLINYCGESGSCGFCNSSSTCSDAGCYWQNDFCYWFAPTSTTDFADYYASNSSFSTPTGFILGWVDFVKPFMENLGNWISAFKERFVLSDASIKGAELGNSIPTARGYLNLIDDFFGGLPVSELFLTFLTILLLIVIFRVIRALVGFLKPL